MHAIVEPATRSARATAAPKVVELGLTDYEQTWRAMQAFTDARTQDSSDEIWLTEHEPIYTLGLAGRTQHLLRANGTPVLKVDRGGQITYHGPGQLVCYLLLDLYRAHLAQQLFATRHYRVKLYIRRSSIRCGTFRMFQRYSNSPGYFERCFELR